MGIFAQIIPLSLSSLVFLYMDKIKYFFDKILDFLEKRGHTQVVILYLGIVAIPVVDLSIDWNNQLVKIGFGTFSILSVITLTIITVPVLVYLRPTKTKVRSKETPDLFESIYIPYFEQIFDYLNVEQYQYWCYHLAVDGGTKIQVEQYDQLHLLIKYINSRPLRIEFADWNNLMSNLNLLIADLISVLDRHLKTFGKDYYTIDRFYKKDLYNANYENDLILYKEEIYLISDLVFELTRLSNLILNRIREIKPDFLLHSGLLIIPGTKWNTFEYRDSEISCSPYPGLFEFENIKSTRLQTYSSQ